MKKFLNFNKIIMFGLLIGIITVGSMIVIDQNQTVNVLVLKQGNEGQAVKDVQTKLKQWGYYSGSVDGIYGSQTKNAVIKFQKKNGLTADGIVGKETFEALGLNKYVTSSGTTSTSSGDELLLAKAIFAEAEGEVYVGKVAVGAVLLNRVADSEFPNTLSGVIYQSYALESVSNGRFNSSANNADCVKAAKAAISGWDPAYGCLYFWNPATATSTWIWSREIVVKYGNHVFGR